MLTITKLTTLKIVVENRSRLIYNKSVKKSKKKSVRRLSQINQLVANIKNIITSMTVLWRVAVIFVSFIKKSDYVCRNNSAYNASYYCKNQKFTKGHISTSFLSEVSIRTECHHSDVTRTA